MFVALKVIWQDDDAVLCHVALDRTGVFIVAKDVVATNRTKHRTQLFIIPTFPIELTIRPKAWAWQRRGRYAVY